MGAPKQKWTSEEEAALKAGIAKHGAGKWRTILKDPEFSGVLSLRSNVDLKDKWRNMRVTATGWGSREKARMALKKSPEIIKPDVNTLASARVVQGDDDIVEPKPLAISAGLLLFAGPKKTIQRLDNLILEAITNLKEPSGSNKTAIAMYIEDQYNAPPNFKGILSAKLKELTAARKLIKAKRKYRIAPSGAFLEARRSSSGIAILEGRQRQSPMATLAGRQRESPSATLEGRQRESPMATLEGRQRDSARLELSKAYIDAELVKMRSMNAQEAAAAAARAVAEAEVAIAEAEQAAREAEEAEADAEAAQAFAEAAMSTLKTRTSPSLMQMVHG